MAIMEQSIVDPNQQVPKSVNDAIRAQTAASEAAYQRELSGQTFKSPFQSEANLGSGLVTSDSAKADINATEDLIGNINQKKAQAKTNVQVDNALDKDIQRFQNAYDQETQLIGDYYDNQIQQTNQFFDSIYTQTTEASDALVQSLKDIYAQRGEEMKVLNQATMGGLTKAGIRSGRNRYAPIIESGILSAEESAGINRIKSLQAEEAQLIAQAQLAKSKEQWALFNDKRTALTELHEKKLTALSDQLDFAIKTENLANSRASNALDKLKEIASVGAPLSPDFAAQVDSTYGQGFAQKYVEATKLAADAQSQEEQLDVAQKLVNLLQDIPEGEEFEFAGNTYTGMKTEDPNTKEWLEKDASGQYQIISYNQDTGEVTVSGTGVRGKVTGSGGSSNTTLSPDQTFEEWLAEKQDFDGQSYNIDDPRVKANLEKLYKEQVGYVSLPEFSPTDIKKLEGANLLGADRATQSKFLYGDEGESISDRYTGAQQTTLRAKYGQDWIQQLENGELTPDEIDDFLSNANSSSRGWQSNG